MSKKKKGGNKKKGGGQGGGGAGGGGGSSPPGKATTTADPAAATPEVETEKDSTAASTATATAAATETATSSPEQQQQQQAQPEQQQQQDGSEEKENSNKVPSSGEEEEKAVSPTSSDDGGGGGGGIDWKTAMMLKHGPGSGDHGKVKGTPSPHTTVHLNSKWTLWFDNPRLAPAGADWKENLKVIATFDTVEMFWRVYNNVRPASQIAPQSNYSLFRSGIEPSWEDPHNCEGGKFVLTLSKTKENAGGGGGGGKNSNNKNGANNGENNNNGGKDGGVDTVPKIDEYWLYSVVALLGETMDATGNEVNGAVVSIRKNQDRIALWLKSSNKDTCVKIGERWKKVLDVETTILRYQMHKDAAASGRSFRNEVQFEV